MAIRAAHIEQARRLGPRARIVQHATLHTGAADAASPLRNALEDALATADFGDCGRLVLVRRLQLQHLPHHAGPVQLARALEAAWRALATQALPHHHPQAAQAPAVFFASRFEARLAWLRRVALGQAAADWFWYAALPELALPAPVKQPIEQLVALLRDEAPEAFKRALTTWPDGDLIAMTRTLSPATLDAWQKQLQVEPDTPTPIETHAATTRATHVDAHTAALQTTAWRLPPAGTAPPAASAWLAALWLAPALLRAPTPGEVAQVLALRSARATAPDASVAVAEPTTAERAPPPAVGSIAPAMSALTKDTSPPHAPGAPVARRGNAPDQRTANTPPAVYRPDETSVRHTTSTGPNTATQPTAPQPHRFRAPSALPWLADVPASTHAGLLLLLNVLQALRFDAWLRTQAPAVQRPFVHALLSQLLDLCGAPPHDPQRAWLASTATDQPLPQALRHWRVQLRRTLRRHAGLDLRDVIVRDGWLNASATHVDVVYPLDEVALPLRRLGLDVDPGWVPWFGHIVAFHFVPRDQLPDPDEGHGGG